jgi:hypothetical protein
MPKGERQKPIGQYAVVHQSYEDKDTAEGVKQVLVPVSTKTHRPLRKPVVRFGEDMDNEGAHRMNMQMVDDAVEDRIFEDEVEEDFDNVWIKQMMTGDGVEEEEFEEMEDQQYPVHTDKRPLERQFDRMMHDFEMDEDIEEEDPRAQGPLDIRDYAPALEQFVMDHADVSYNNPNEPIHQKGLMNQMRMFAAKNRVFDSNADGHFVVALDADKGKRMNGYFFEDKEGLKQITLQRIREGAIDTTDVLCRDEEDEPMVAVEVKAKDRVDCETVLTTYTNVYNHPTVIAGHNKKMKLTMAAAKRAKQQHAAEMASKEERHTDPAITSAGKKSPAMGPVKVVPRVFAAAASPAAGEPDEDDLFADLPDEALPTMMDLSTRPKDETKEEKALRRALVKEMQRERRAEKKETRMAYREAGTTHAAIDAKQKLDKKTMSMSLVRR